MAQSRSFKNIVLAAAGDAGTVFGWLSDRRQNGPNAARQGSGAWTESSFTVLEGKYGTLRAPIMYCVARMVVLRKTHQ